MLGYWGRPDATAEVLVDGELHTGDVGALDADGLLHVRDRRSLVIIRGGANVYPAEVERVLQEAPGVAAAAVFAIPDERLGERVVAAIEVVEMVDTLERVEPIDPFDPEAVRRYCAAHLAAYKVPERVVVVERLPRNAMGKIIRHELAEVAFGR
jgi:acyl-CoA synthetase (AMP-forming)/AMP-acid ligase II